MKNVIRSQGKIWQRRSKNLKSGDIQCPTCGEWTTFKKLTDKHFNEEFVCKGCKPPKPKPKPKKKTAKKPKPTFPEDCPHKPFFACKRPSECVGCYYNPDKKIALATKHEDDPKKNAKDHWFYHSKKHAKERLKNLDDIKHGRGLLKGGNRSYFKYARKSADEED